jgi:hypothetical protein
MVLESVRDRRDMRLSLGVPAEGDCRFTARADTRGTPGHKESDLLREMRG